MSLPHAILGILQQCPMTGYNLKNEAFDGSIAHFWPADQAQIYRTLEKMTDEGWVESETEIQDGRPNRKVFSITEEGISELKRWLSVFQPLPPYRDAFLIQLFFANLLPNAQISHMLEGQVEAHRARLAVYESIPVPPLGTANRDITLQRLTLELGLRLEAAYLDWLKLATETVNNLPEGD